MTRLKQPIDLPFQPYIFRHAIRKRSLTQCLKLDSYITGQIWISIPSTIPKGMETEMSYLFTSFMRTIWMGHGREAMSTCSQPRAEIMFPSTAHIEGMNTETDTFWFVKVVGDKLLKNEKIHKKNEKSNDLFHSIRTNNKKTLDYE